MKQPKILIFAAVLATGLSGIALAFAGPHGTDARGSIDANADGVVTRAEAAAHPRLATRFDQLDTNRDGRLEPSERRMHGGKAHGRGGHLERLVKLDANGDGRIARVEATQGMLARKFDALDANRDGYLVSSEIDAGMQRMRAQRGVQREQKQREAFTKADRNRDGRLARDEVAQAMPRLQKAFTFLDENRDGFLSAQEMRFGRSHR